jgi:hypothetical protein
MGPPDRIGFLIRRAADAWLPLTWQPAIDQKRGQRRGRQHHCAQPEPACAGVATNGLVPELLLQGCVHLFELIDVRGVVHAAAGQFRDLLQRLAGHWHREMLVVEIDVPVGRPERDR